MYKKNLLIKLLIGICVVLFFVFLLLLQTNRVPKTYEVVLNSKGFSPSLLTIQEGDTVKFITKQSKPFWPASDPHPIHTLYSVFDPRRPIQPNSSWEFTFKDIGTWPYHDHLFSYFHGVIIVNKKGTLPFLSVFQSRTYKCGGVKIECWKKEIADIAYKKGVNEAFAEIKHLYDTEPEFGSACHDVMHSLGENASRLFSSGVNIAVGFDSSYCGFGFYHGFMQGILVNTGKYQTARTLCSHFSNQIKNLNKDAKNNIEGACYHGIGHGLAEILVQDRGVIDGNAFISSGIKECEQIGSTDAYKSRCISGLINSFVLFLEDPSYHLSYDKIHPYELCDQIENKAYIKFSCYDQMNVLVLSLISDSNLVRAVQFPLAIKDDTYRATAIQGISSLYAKTFFEKNKTVKSVVDDCYSITLVDSRKSCVQGFVSGLLEFGKPEIEYQRMLEFCGSRSMDTSDRKACYERMGWAMHLSYSKEKIETICRSVDGEFKSSCLKYKDYSK